MRLIVCALLLALANCATPGLANADPAFTPADIRASLSFSPLAIDSALADASGLHRLDERGCVACEECDYADARGVRHYFFNARLVVKSVRADEFEGRNIGALGIGSARARTDVLRRVRAFLPVVEIDCTDGRNAEGATNPATATASECGAMVGRGWFRVWFDAQDKLLEARLDGYHFI